MRPQAACQFASPQKVGTVTDARITPVPNGRQRPTRSPNELSGVRVPIARGSLHHRGSLHRAIPHGCCYCYCARGQIDGRFLGPMALTAGFRFWGRVLPKGSTAGRFSFPRELRTRCAAPLPPLPLGRGRARERGARPHLRRRNPARLRGTHARVRRLRTADTPAVAIAPLHYCCCCCGSGTGRLHSTRRMRASPKKSHQEWAPAPSFLINCCRRCLAFAYVWRTSVANGRRSEATRSCSPLVAAVA